jgi:ubiquinone/menaquinone biosynthesis C-methylase UbiE
VRILCDYLVTKGFLTKKDRTYFLTPATALFLDRKSPAYMGGVTRFLAAPELTGTFRDTAAAVRKGGTVMAQEGTLAAEHPLWVEFARGMAPLVEPTARFVAELVGASQEPLRVLDIAAGHGLYGIQVAHKNPKAEIVAVDWPAVLEVAEQNARKAGVGERYRPMPGSAFDVDFGSGYDVVLLTNFFHHFDIPTCVGLMRKVAAALKNNGRAFTVEFVPDEDRVSPPESAGFGFVMLCSTPAGDAYTFSEYRKMLEEAGFKKNALQATPIGTPQHVIVSEK